MSDYYGCPGCSFAWGGYGRSPPYANCPECDEYMMREVSKEEFDLLVAGFVPARLV